MDKETLGDLIADTHDRIKSGIRFLEDHRYLVAPQPAQVFIGLLNQIDGAGITLRVKKNPTRVDTARFLDDPH